MRHLIIPSAALRAAELRVRTSEPAVFADSDNSQHRTQPRANGELTYDSPIEYAHSREWRPDWWKVQEQRVREARQGEGRNLLRRKMNMLDMRDGEQPVWGDAEKQWPPVDYAKPEPIVNQLGNTPDVGEVPPNIQANETVPYNHYAREFIWPNQEK